VISIFITFEGADGAGKSTQLGLCYKALIDRGYTNVFKTREPGGTAIAEKIRAILKDTSNGEMCDATEVLLLMASRAQMVEEVIRPKLKEGGIVLCDRFVDSTFAYQVQDGRYTRWEDVLQLHRYTARDLWPDLTIVLCDGGNGLERTAVREGEVEVCRIEAKGNEYQQKVRGGFKRVQAEFPQRVVTIDGTRSICEVHKDVMEVVNKYID
jgi:dTMP kinase